MEERELHIIITGNKRALFKQLMHIIMQMQDDVTNGDGWCIASSKEIRSHTTFVIEDNYKKLKELQHETGS